MDVGWTNELSRIHDEDLYITHGKFLEASRNSSSFDYQKRDYVFRRGSWRGTPTGPYRNRSQDLRALVIGHSAMNAPRPQMSILRLIHGLERVWAKNLSGGFTPRSTIQPIPLGRTNDSAESPLHKVLGNPNHLRNAWAAKPQSSTKLYLNINVHTASGHRSSLLSVSRKIGRSTIAISEPELTDTGRVRYLRDIAKFGLVLCPRGRGKDTHRFWETLYMGGIPVVLAGSYQARLASHLRLPVIQLSSWQRLLDKNTVKRVFSEAEALVDSPQTVSALDVTSWITKFSGDVGRFSHETI